MKIAICDDCREDTDRLEKAIGAHPRSECLDVEVYTSPEKLLHRISDGKAFDLVFLDVSLPEINGIELGKKIREYLPKIFMVFTTNYPQYALDAYECEAYHYLIKPVAEEKLHTVLDKLIKSFRDKSSEYVIRGRFENTRVRVSDILYVEYYKKHVCFHIDSPDKQQYEVVGSLSDVYDKLKIFGFFRCHQAFIVNLGKISRFDGYNIILSSGDILPVSVRNKADLIVAYTDYYEERG